MSEEMARFTAYLSASEREAISKRAMLLGASDNYVVRVCIRASLGMPIPELEFLRTVTERTEQIEPKVKA